MRTQVFLNTGGNIMKDKSNTNQSNSPFMNTNSSHYLSTMNNRSLSTNESGTAYTSNMYNRTNINGNRKFNKFSSLKLHPETTYKEQNIEENIDQNSNNDILNDFYSTAKVSSKRKEVFKDADLILKDRIRRLGGTGPLRQTRTSVLEKTKEVCLNNYLITQLKEKRTDINNKEIFINHALKSSETQFEIDYKTFIDFVEEIKKKEKEDEEKLSNLKVTREKIENELNQYIYTNKKLEDESEHTIKQIIILKTYGSFVHKVFQIPFIFDELKEIKPPGKKYINLSNKIINLYNKNEYFQIPEDKLKDDELLMQFSNYEEKLVKILEDKERLDQEIHVIKCSQEAELEQLKQRLKDCEIEEKVVLQAKAGMGHIVQMSQSEHEFEEVGKYLEYISELGKGVGVDVPKGGTKSKSISDCLYLCKDTINALNEKECLINNYITEIEDIINNSDKNDQEIIENLINEQKKCIKREKQLKLKKEKEEEEFAKSQRAIERAKRIVVKGRKVYHENPPHKRKNKKVKVVENADDELYQYLNYSSSNDSNN